MNEIEKSVYITLKKISNFSRSKLTENYLFNAGVTTGKNTSLYKAVMSQYLIHIIKFNHE